MALTTLDSVIAAFPGQNFQISKVSVTTEAAGVWTSLWNVAGNPTAAGTPPTTAAAPTKATTGAYNFTNAGAGNSLYLANLQISSTSPGTLMIYDRLCHVSGLSGTQTTVDTAVSNTALTRYTTGAGVELWAEVYTAFGATAATLNYKYTDQDGNTAQASSIAYPGGVPGATGAPTANQMFPLPLASGDTGVRAVTNYHWSVSTTVAGNFGFVLLKPLAFIDLTAFSNTSASTGRTLDLFDLGLPAIPNDACLGFAWMPSSTVSGYLKGNFKLVEG